MSNEVAENLREIASNLLAAASRLDGIDASADAMRSGTVCVPPGFSLGTLGGAAVELVCVRCSDRWSVRDRGDGAQDFIDLVTAAHDKRRHDQCPQGMPDGWGHLGGPDCAYPSRGGTLGQRA